MKAKQTISHCYWPADGWIIAQGDELFARMPPELPHKYFGVEELVEALDRVANSDHDFAADLEPELHAYSAKTPLGWRIHAGDGVLVAHVPPYTRNSEKKAALLVRAADALWLVLYEKMQARMPREKPRRKAKAHAK